MRSHLGPRVQSACHTPTGDLLAHDATATARHSFYFLLSPTPQVGFLMLQGIVPPLYHNMVIDNILGHLASKPLSLLQRLLLTPPLPSRGTLRVAHPATGATVSPMHEVKTRIHSALSHIVFFE